MKNKILIETIEEFIEFSNPNRVIGDAKPFLNPLTVTLIVTSYNGLRLEDIEEKYILASDITYQDLIEAMIKELHLNIEFEKRK